ncbi:Permease of the major facilitator superfamily [Caenispirillum salinarum AK4]|uniref:Permease of the major facilitator superfamily n=1 Tax=Caenispirillum salinarum AK4 TaxID=1238182 RepID=K9HT83_9PROT|nr:DUF3429 domain-containing protein [Caenispirillum salinarum]EKV31506.1 Permease of the major facilitator superfamily [Caenispirillum salinarum AK4]
MSLSDADIPGRHLEIDEPPRVPLLDLFFAYGAMAPLIVGAGAVWLADEPVAALAVQASILWGGVILAFLSGVRRGLSFRTPGGPTLAQLAMFLWLFGAGILAFALPQGAALGVLVAAYASMAVLDPVAARRGEVPIYFARLRPWQMGLAVAALVVLWAGAP